MGSCMSQPDVVPSQTAKATLDASNLKAPTETTTHAFFEAVKTRRTHYVLSDKSPVSDSKLLEMVEEAVKHCPTSFNSQSSRAVLLTGEDQIKLWDFAKEAIKAVSPESGWEASMARLSGFQNAHGTVLLFEDKSVIEGLQVAMPTYADKFPQWADHANGMLAYILWTAFTLAGLGCNLQHYNPLIDASIIKEWGIPKNWELKAQLVFGGIEGEKGEGAGIKEFKEVKGERVRAFSGKKSDNREQETTVVA